MRSVCRQKERINLGVFDSCSALWSSRSSKAKSLPLLLLAGFCRCVLLEWAQWLSRHLQLPAGEAPGSAWLSLPWRRRLGSLAMCRDAPGYDDLAGVIRQSPPSIFASRRMGRIEQTAREKPHKLQGKFNTAFLSPSFSGFDLQGCRLKEASTSWIHPARPPHAPNSWCMMYFRTFFFFTLPPPLLPFWSSIFSGALSCKSDHEYSWLRWTSRSLTCPRHTFVRLVSLRSEDGWMAGAGATQIPWNI